MARRKLSMNEYLEMVYQWHRGRSVRQIRDSLRISERTSRGGIRDLISLCDVSSAFLCRRAPCGDQEANALVTARLTPLAIRSVCDAFLQIPRTRHDQ